VVHRTGYRQLLRWRRFGVYPAIARRGSIRSKPCAGVDETHSVREAGASPSTSSRQQLRSALSAGRRHRHRHGHGDGLIVAGFANRSSIRRGRGADDLRVLRYLHHRVIPTRAARGAIRPKLLPQDAEAIARLPEITTRPSGRRSFSGSSTAEITRASSACSVPTTLHGNSRGGVSSGARSPRPSCAWSADRDCGQRTIDRCSAHQSVGRVIQIGGIRSSHRVWQRRRISQYRGARDRRCAVRVARRSFIIDEWNS